MHKQIFKGNQMKGTVFYEVIDNVAVLTVDNPPVNPLSDGVRQGAYEGMVRAEEDPSVKAVVITGNGRAFIAGADISEFGGSGEGHNLNEVFKKIEFSSKPVVAAINGLALGGGLETALCCNYRIASAEAFMGLPEVNLGLLPGAGGTQRLPRLIGPSEALKMIISGAHISAKKAHSLGIVDLISENILEDSIKFALNKANSSESHPKVRDLNDKVIEARGSDNVLIEAKALAAKTRKGQYAPGQIIKCVEAAIDCDDFDEGLKKEGAYFLECLMHPQREAMIHIFFGERAASKILDVPKETQLKKINRAAVIGSGTMGGGIAMCFANAGIPVHIIDQDSDNLKRGIGVIESNYNYMVKRGRINEDQKNAIFGLISSSLKYEDIKDVDIVIEAVYENLELKTSIFKSLDQHVNKDAILASNTSGLDIDSIAQATGRPEKVVGTHFFSPANIMRLLEVVRGDASSNETLATVMSLGKKLKKASVVSLNAPGFIGNRMLSGYTTQANMLLLEGALPHQVDQALESFGMSMGPFRMLDLVGLDLGWRARKLSGKDAPLASKINDELCEQGKFGQKNSKGFYNYNEGSRAPNPAPENEEIYKKVSANNGFERRDISDVEIVDRCILSLVNEGAQILSEGVAQRAVDMDVVYINGYGFPIWRGGPMHHANTLGIKEVVERLNKYKELTKDVSFTPSKMLLDLADNDEKLVNAPEVGKRQEKLAFNSPSIGNKNF
ncbi:3-hydroxyacyl-CoA dehydrogenase NAD-binding domain-containing protein [Gammaproteobacteria bacterium]|nr:3-hydroxyacyl-CoA dehydrogenase NAD-binding domain-containing protein [Gammaproteobacteria bacterium]MDA9196043.1 3-hydroxyacyl-CoA dehydrogenase NAD-binding domain-containing protein [Gammaproteobacteria bacterium]